MIVFFLLTFFPLSLFCSNIFGEDGIFEPHSDNWAVLVCTSRFWFNYRHVSNALGVYHILKENGFSDDHIILMLADDIACNPRNVFPGRVFNNPNHAMNLYNEDIEVDYRGYEVTVDNFLRVLTNRHSEKVSKNKKMSSDENSNILIYLTGHGGDEFLKFQDIEEITAEDLSQTIRQMELKKLYKEMLLIVDTCQASTFFQRIDSKGIITAASSSLAESSYSLSNDPVIGVSVIDRFTYYTLDFFQRNRGKWKSKNTIYDLFRSYQPSKLNAHPQFRTDLMDRDVRDIPLTDFFSRNIRLDFDFKEYPLIIQMMEQQQQQQQQQMTTKKRFQNTESLSRDSKEEVVRMILSIIVERSGMLSWAIAAIIVLSSIMI